MPAALAAWYPDFAWLQLTPMVMIACAWAAMACRSPLLYASPMPKLPSKTVAFQPSAWAASLELATGWEQPSLAWPQEMIQRLTPLLCGGAEVGGAVK
jgi:hypothetical protein